MSTGVTGTTSAAVARAALGVLGALVYLYYAGWSYAQYYYRFFGLMPDHMNVPTHSIFAYAPEVFAGNAALGWKAALSVGLAAFLWIWWKKAALRVYTAAAVLLLLFPALRWLAAVSVVEIASRHVEQGLVHAPVSLVLAERSVADPRWTALLDANRTDRLRFLAESQRSYFLLEGRSAASFIVHEVPKALVDLRSVRGPGLR